MLCEEAKRIDVVGLFGLSPPYLPGSLQLVPVTRIENNVTNGGLENWRRGPAEKIYKTHTIYKTPFIRPFIRHTPGHCRHSRDSASVSGTQSHAGTLPAWPGHCRHSATLPASLRHCSHAGTLPARPEHSQDSVIVSGTRSPWENRRTARMPLCWSRCRRVNQVAVRLAGSPSG